MYPKINKLVLDKDKNIKEIEVIAKGRKRHSSAL